MENGKGLAYRHDPKVRARIDTAIAYLTTHEEELLAKPVGKYPLEEGIEVRVQSYDSRPYEGMSYETHRDHIDLHYMLQGQEYVRWWDKGSVEPNTEYDEVEDIIFYPHPPRHNRALLTDHHYVLVYPEDMHAAHGMVDGKVSHNHKVVVKISVL